jgi:hypothetical protein
MPDLATISAALSSLKTATDIAKFLRQSDLSLEKAELKLKLADLVSALADAKMELAEVQETLHEKDQRISELEHSFQLSATLVRQYDAYYAADANGLLSGVPYCLRCWENEHKARQLVYDAKDNRVRVCTSCGQKYNSDFSEDIQPPLKQPPT